LPFGRGGRPAAFRELFPELHDSDFPFRAPVRNEAVYLLTPERRLRLPTPPTMRNQGNYIASLCEIVAGSARRLKRSA